MGGINSGGYYLMTPHTKEIIIFASDSEMLHITEKNKLDFFFWC